MSDSLLTDQIKVLISKRHAGDPRMPDWAVFFELRDGTGAGSYGQSIDAFAMHTWPSKGYRRIGYEIKASRSDFLREMKIPEKRAWAMSITHEFWFVAPAKVIDPAEVPVDCGLLLVTADGNKLRTVKVAPHREPRDLTMNEVAAFARKACDGGVLKSARWKLAGRELSDDDLTAILAERRTAIEAEEFSKRVSEAADEQMERVRKSLNLYAEALREAGCEPPDWMLGDSLGSHFASEWGARSWVAKNVTSNPGSDRLRLADTAIKGAVANLQRVQGSIEELLESEVRR